MRPPFRLERSFWPAILLLLALFMLFEHSPIDLWFQDFFFNFSTGIWMINQESPLPRAIFYTGAKVLIIAFSLVLIGLTVGPRSWLQKFKIPDPARRRLLVVILTVASIPWGIGQLKTATNVYCPYDIQRYGGEVVYVRVMEPYPPGQRPEERSRGFPAGHASGGYALLALAGLAATRRGQLTGIAIGFTMGGIMGFYQIAKGAHYLSHTVVTALLAWIGFLIWRWIFIRPRERP